MDSKKNKALWIRDPATAHPKKPGDLKKSFEISPIFYSLFLSINNPLLLHHLPKPKKEKKGEKEKFDSIKAIFPIFVL